MQSRAPLDVFRENLRHLQAGRPLSAVARDRAFEAKLAEMTRGRSRWWHDAGLRREQLAARLNAEAAARRFWMPMQSLAGWYRQRQIDNVLRLGRRRGQ